MLQNKIKHILILYIFLSNTFNIKSKLDEKITYTIKSETINLTNLKNIIFVPNFMLFSDNNIVEKMKNYINNTLYKNISFEINKKISDSLSKIKKENKNLEIKNNVDIIIKKELENFKKNHFLLYIFNTENKSDNIFSEKKTLEKCEEINNHFINNGFLDSKTTYNIDVIKNEVNITYNVDEGEMYKIEKINILSKNSEIKEIISNQIKKFKKNTPYNKTKIDKFKDNSIKELNNLGYFFISNDNYKINIYKDSIKKNVELYICIIPNNNFELEKFKYGDIIFKYITSNNDKFKKKKEVIYKISKPIKEDLIISKINLPKGKTYSKESIDNAYFNLYNTEIFDNITIKFLKKNNIIKPNFILKLKKPFLLEYTSTINLNKTEIDTNNNFSISFRNLFKRMEILKILVSYWQLIPFKKEYQKKYQNKFSLGFSCKYPFSLIFGKRCKLTSIELLFKKKPLFRKFSKSILKSYIQINHEISIKNLLDFTLKITPFHIKKTPENFVQSKSIMFTSNLNIYNVFFNKLNIEFNNVFISKNYINYFKLLLKYNTSTKMNAMLKIMYEPKLIIKPTQESELIINLIIGRIFSLKNITLYEDKLFQLGGETYLRAWEKGEIGLQTTKNGKGNIILFAYTEFNYNISSYINLNTSVECGNIWLNENKDKQINNKFNFQFNKKLFKELYLDTGVGIKLKTGIIDIKIDLLIKILDNNKVKKEPYKIRIKINN